MGRQDGAGPQRKRIGKSKRVENFVTKASPRENPARLRRGIETRCNNRLKLKMARHMKAVAPKSVFTNGA